MNKTKVILSALIFVVFVIGVINCALIPPKGDRYYLPDLYSGWICVHYNVVGAPPLTTEDGFLLHRVPPNGIIKTSSAPRFSPKSDEYYYYNDKGIRKAKELQHGGGYSQQKQGDQEFRFYFWVSSSNSNYDYEKYVKNRDINSEPMCGPWRTY